MMVFANYVICTSATNRNANQISVSANYMKDFLPTELQQQQQQYAVANAYVGLFSSVL